MSVTEAPPRPPTAIQRRQGLERLALDWPPDGQVCLCHAIRLALLVHVSLPVHKPGCGCGHCTESLWNAYLADLATLNGLLTGGLEPVDIDEDYARCGDLARDVAIGEWAGVVAGDLDVLTYGEGGRR